jgi:hypothetical protein
MALPYAEQLLHTPLTREEVQRLFLAAVSLSDAALVTALLLPPSHASVSWPLENGLPALHFAAARGDTPLLLALLGAVAQREAAGVAAPLPPSTPAPGRGSAVRLRRRTQNLRAHACPNPNTRTNPFTKTARAQRTRHALPRAPLLRRRARPQ